MTNVYSFCISHNAGFSPRATLVGPSSSVHHVNYAPNIFHHHHHLTMQVTLLVQHL